VAIDASERLMFRGFAWQIILPYRIFMDDTVYNFSIGGRKWMLRLLTRKQPSPRLTMLSMIEMSPRHQIKLDNSGVTGLTEAILIWLFDEVLSRSKVDDLYFREKKMRLEFALTAINKFISLYRFKTNEFWFRPIAPADIFCHFEGLLPVGSNKIDFYSSSSLNQGLFTHPYLKSTNWYADFIHHLNLNWEVPFFMELIFEGEDALERANYRLAVANFALAVESLLRNIIYEFFGEKYSNMPAKNMIGYYYNNYHKIDTPKNLPLKKTEAKRLFDRAWKNRDKIMHGHELRIPPREVAEAGDAARRLSALWFRRPGGPPSPTVEGGFSGHDSPKEAKIWVERAHVLLKNGDIIGAEESATFASLLHRNHDGAKAILCTIAKIKKKTDNC